MKLASLTTLAIMIVSSFSIAQTLNYSQQVDLSDFTLDGSQDLSATTGVWGGLRFNNDGTKLYLNARLTSIVYEFDLTTPYDITSGFSSSGNAFDDGIALGSRDVLFSADGNRMYIPYFNSVSISQYDLASPFQIDSDVTLDNGFGFYYPQVLQFNKDGSRLIVLHNNSDLDDAISQVELTTPYDITGGFTLSGELDISGDVIGPGGMVFDAGGRNMYVLDNKEILHYELSSPYQVVSGASLTADPVDFSDGLTSVGTAFAMSPDNTKIYLAWQDGISQFSRGEAFKESSTSDGSVTGGIVISLNGDTFVNAGSTLTETTHYSLANVPSGLTSIITVDGSGTFATLTFSGNATVWNDVTDIQFTFTDAAFTNSDASDFGNAVGESTNFGIDFNERYLTFGPTTDITVATEVGHQGTFDVSSQLSVPAGFTFNPDGTKMYVTGLDANINQYTLTSPFNITSGVSFDGSPLDVSGEETFPQDVAFNTDGTKMFVVGSIGQEVNQYSLDEPFDITTGVTHDGSPFDLSGEDGLPIGIAFNTVGTRMYVIGNSDDELNQYALSNPFDITSGVSHEGSLSLSLENGSPRGIAFNATGTRLFIVDEAGDEVNQYYLDGAFDVTTGVTFAGSPLDISSEESNATDIFITSNGVNMLILGLGDDEINQYKLRSYFHESVANDGTVSGSAVIGISGDTFTNAGGTFTHGVEYSIGNLPAGLTSTLTIDDNGLVATLTISGTASTHGSADGIGSLEFTFNNAAFTQGDASIFTNATAEGSGISIRFIDAPELFFERSIGIEIGAELDYTFDATSTYQPLGLTFNNDGTMFITSTNTLDAIAQYILDTPYDLAGGITFDLTRSVAAQTSYPADVEYSKDGMKMYVLGTTSISQYTLNSPFDIRLGFTYDGNSTSLISENGGPRGMAFSRDGMKIFISGTSPKEVNQYSLSTPFDVTSGMTFDGSPFPADATNGITFNKSGTRMFTAGGSEIIEYHIANPFDITSGVTEQNNSLNVSTFETSINDIEFIPDGSKLLVAGLGFGNYIHQVSMQIPYDVATIGVGHETEYSVSAEEANPEGVAFSSDGLSMFVVGSGSAGSAKEINSYTLSSAFDVSSSVSHDATLDVSVTDMVFSPTGLAFSSDGMTLFVLGAGVDDMVFQYSLTSAYDISTGVSYDDDPLDVSAQNSNPTGLTFNHDGTKMYIVGYIEDEINQFSLSSPFDITSGVTYDGNSFDLSNESDFSYDLAFSPGGSKLFVLDYNEEKIFQYLLESPFDVTSGVTYDTDKDISYYDMQPYGIYINSEGTKMYISGKNPSPPFDEPIEQFSFGSSDFSETLENDGSVYGDLTIVLRGETFTNQGGTLISPTHFSISGLPSGLTPELHVSSNGSTASLTLTGNASAHESNANVGDLEFTFENAAFTSNSASSIVNTTNASSDIGINFNDNNAPAFYSITYTEVHENEIGTVLDVDASNGEGGDDDNGITYSITGGLDQDDFSIDPANGLISFISSPDFENPDDFDTDNEYLLEVTADDGGSANNLTVQMITIMVNDVDEDPVFVSAVAADFDENATSVVIDVDASDGDGGIVDTGITYSFSGGADDTDFSIDFNTGEVTFNAAPDFESPADANSDNDYELQVTASDGVNTADQNIIISVTDVNENPVFSSSTTANFDENGTGVILDVNATDGDDGNNDDGITYSVSGGVDQSLFAIDASIGELTFQSSPDFENPVDMDTDNDYELEIDADDGTNITTQALSITVVDVNEVPEFISATSTSFEENSSIVVIDVDANNGDGGAVDSGITYSINGGVDQFDFTINDNGFLTFTTTPDFENPQDDDGDNEYEIQVNAWDGVNGTNQSIVINVTNIDESPIFITSSTFDYLENSTDPIDIDANDGDGGASDAGVTYSISGGDDETLFSINSVSGELAFTTSPDHESPTDANQDNIYLVEVTANDGVNSSVLSITITVINEDEPPIITVSSSIDFEENSTNSVVEVTATNGDGGIVDEDITYSLGGDDQGFFTIGSSTGILDFLSAPDYENPQDTDADNIYELEVTASDGINTTDATFTVSVTNINEVPVFTSSSSVDFIENSVSDVIDVNANNGDGGNEDAGIMYSLVGGTDISRFNVNSSDGVLTFNVSPDYENPVDTNGDNIYQIEVAASDGFESSIQLITVTVTNTNENPVISAQAFSLDENSAFGTLVGTVQATDEDGDPVSYLLVSGNTNSAFTLDNNSGELTVNSPTVLDFETIQSFDLLVQVFDGNGGSATATITVNLNDIDETGNTDPVIADQTFSLDENSAFGTVVGTVVASDDDGDPLTYSITSGNTNSAFTISGSSGELTVNSASALDFETTPSFGLIVEVNDGNGGFASATITVNLNDIDETGNTDPVIADQTFSLDENSAFGTVVGTVVATDDDGDPLTYSITSGNTNSAFTISSSSGELTVNSASALDFEKTPSFGLTVEVNDGNGGFASATITVNLNDINETGNTDPVIADQTFSVDENSAMSTVVGTVVASDDDGDPLTYSITSGNTSSAFAISSSSGELTVNSASALDFETTPSFGLTVEVNDGNGGFASAIITVNLNDIDEISNTDPIIADQTFSVDENSAMSTVVGTVVASDDDGDPLTYSITSGNTSSAFAISSSSGELTVNSASALDFETTPSFDLVVEVNDGNGGIASATIAITVNQVLGSSSIETIEVFPNPNEGLVNISFPEAIEEAHLTVMNLTGSILSDVYLQRIENTYQMDMSDFKDGIYIIRINSNKIEEENVIVIKGQ
ncbi:cadherin domain-containing protein [Ekhidna sp.]|uniref:cadherin domain-containing protein n=1 Tax=Ekhidna sp. TaxID=2608089 RepID=UPI003CCC2C11